MMRHLDLIPCSINPFYFIIFKFYISMFLIFIASKFYLTKVLAVYLTLREVV